MTSTDTIRAWKHATAAGGAGYAVLWRGAVISQAGVPASRRLPVTACQWAWDGASTQPLSGSITVPAIDWSSDVPVDWRPTHVRAPLTPFGNRVALEMGVDAGDGPIWVSLGIGLITSVDYDRPAETITVTLGDVAAEVAQALTVTDFTLVQDVPLSQFVGLVFAGAHLRRPDLSDPRGILPGTIPAGRTWPPGTSLWDVLQDGVQTVDPTARAWFDRDGTLRFDRMALDTSRPPGEQLAARPDWSLRTGDGGHVIEVRSTLTRDGAVNLVAVSVEDSEVVDPEYGDADTPTETDGLGALRKGFEETGMSTIGGTATGMAVSKPSGRTQGWTDKQPTPPRWPFADAGAHPMGAPFGQKGQIWSQGWHTGADFSAPNSGTVVAVCQGPVVSVGGPEAGWAGPHYVTQQASDGTRFIYAHLASAAVKPGQFLLRGDTIGQAGDTGRAFGIHLHLERRVAPYGWPGSCRDWRGQGDVK